MAAHSTINATKKAIAPLGINCSFNVSFFITDRLYVVAFTE